jgi:hypothetical protein
VLAGVDGRLEVQRPEVRRRAEQHDFDIALHDPLVAVKAGEGCVVGDPHLLVELGLQPLAGVGHPVGEQIAHHRQAVIRIGLHGVDRGSRSAAAAADERHVDRIAPLRVDRGNRTQRSQGATDCHRRRCLQKRAARRRRMIRIGTSWHERGLLKVGERREATGEAEMAPPRPVPERS